MSAFGIGRSPSVAISGAEKPDPGAYAGRVVQWIPGDVLALYAASVLWLSDGGSKPSATLLIIYTIVTPLIVLLGAWSNQQDQQWRVVIVKAALSVPAFLIWSLAIPGSGWQKWSVVSEHDGRVAAITALAGVIFSLIAGGVDARFKMSSPSPAVR